MDAADVIAMQQSVAQVKVDDSLLDYALDIGERTRPPEQHSLGVTPRGPDMPHRAAQARAPFLEGRDYCLPDDFQTPGSFQFSRTAWLSTLSLCLHPEKLRTGRIHPPRNRRLQPASPL